MKVFSQLEKAQLENTTSDTGSLPKGMITYRTDLNIAKVSDGTNMLALIDESSTQTLSGKTYATPNFTGAFNMEQTATPANPSAGSNKFYFKADGKLYTLDSSGNEAQVGSGSGGGVKNLITNGSADDTASSIFTPYQDSSGTRPADGTGGTTTGITTSITSSSPLDGTKAFLLTKDAANRQGGGWAVSSFTVDPAYRAKSLKISVDYIINSGTFVAGGAGVESDVIWYIYDITNSQLIEPSNIKMFSNSSTISDKFEATFQTSATGASYRLIAHIQSTSALAYELKVDNITVSPQNYVFGTPVTDWKAYTPTVSNLGSGALATNSAKWRRVGDSMELEIYSIKDATAGTGALAVTWSLPSGYSIDTTKLGNNGAGFNLVGNLVDAQSGYTGSILSLAGGTGIFAYAVAPTTGQWSGSSFAANKTISIRAVVPIVGWSSSVQTSDSADTRVVAAHGYDTGSTVYNSNAARQQMPLDTALYDTHGMISGNVITIPVSGYYEIKGKALWSGGNMVSGGTYELLVTTGSVGGTVVAADDQRCAAAGAFVTNNVNMTRYFTAGTTLYAVLISSANHSVSTVTVDGTAAHWSYLSVARVTGPSAIAASELVGMSYENTAGTSITTSNATVTFANKNFDTHNAYSGGVFTAPVAGKYFVSANMFSVTTLSATAGWYLKIVKNGSTSVFVNTKAGTGAANTTNCVAVSGIVELKAGDTLRVDCQLDAAGPISLTSSAGYNVFTVAKIGGV